MSAPRTAVVAALAVFACSAAAQAPDGRNLLKGKVKPGLYENVTHSEMKGVPGVKKGQEKSTETRQRCVTQEELDKGIEFPGNCAIRKRDDTGSSVQLVAECKDGAVHEFRIAATAGGFSSEMKTVGKNPDGSAVSLAMRSESRYLGPCKD
jgi:hypothetical protein